MNPINPLNMINGMVTRFDNWRSNGKDATVNDQATQNTTHCGASSKSNNGHSQNHSNIHHGGTKKKNRRSKTKKGRHNNQQNQFNSDFHAHDGKNACGHDQHRREHQVQQQSYDNTQRQQIAQTQTFIEQVDDTISCISLAAEQYHNGQDEEMVDLLCDSAVVALNMLAVSCEQLYQEKNEDALDLGRNQAHIKLAELESKNKAVFELVEPHRNFINAALNGQRNLRYNEDRVEPGAKRLFDRTPAQMKSVYAQVIHQQQTFDKSHQALLEQKTNDELAKKQASTLIEYRRHKKSKDRSKSGSQYHRPKVADLYFTENAKSAKFVDAEAVERAKQGQQAMREVDGLGDAYDDIMEKNRFGNAILKLTEKNQWNNISEAIPCAILVPDEEERKNQDRDMVRIRPCYPWNNGTLLVSLSLLEYVDENEIKQIEQKHIKFYQKLGYKTIKEQDKEIEMDDYEDEDNDAAITGDPPFETIGTTMNNTRSMGPIQNVTSNNSSNSMGIINNDKNMHLPTHNTTQISQHTMATSSNKSNQNSVNSGDNSQSIHTSASQHIDGTVERVEAVQITQGKSAIDIDSYEDEVSNDEDEDGYGDSQMYGNDSNK